MALALSLFGQPAMSATVRKGFDLADGRTSVGHIVDEGSTGYLLETGLRQKIWIAPGGPGPNPGTCRRTRCRASTATASNHGKSRHHQRRTANYLRNHQSWRHPLLLGLLLKHLPTKQKTDSNFSRWRPPLWSEHHWTNSMLGFEPFRPKHRKPTAVSRREILGAPFSDHAVRAGEGRCQGLVPIWGGGLDFPKINPARDRITT
jgi:hypothetical protein